MTYPVKYVPIKIVVLGVDAEVLHRLRALVGKQLEDYVTESCVKNCSLVVSWP
jgi:hypothetical protein